MNNISNMEIEDAVHEVTFGRRAMLVCLEELAWHLRKRYANRIPTARNRFKIFVRKHIEQLRARDIRFDDYIKLLGLVEQTDDPETKYLIRINK